jgi:putative DNA primase/helicase
MRQDFFTFVPQFKLTIVGNHQPVLKNVDDAARRRFNIVPFTRKPSHPNPPTREKLRADTPRFCGG